METNIAQHMRSERKKEIKANATQNSETHYSQFSIIPEALQNALKWWAMESAEDKKQLKMIRKYFVKGTSTLWTAITAGEMYW